MKQARPSPQAETASPAEEESSGAQSAATPHSHLRRLVRASALLALGLLVQAWADRTMVPQTVAEDVPPAGVENEVTLQPVSLQDSVAAGRSETEAPDSPERMSDQRLEVRGTSGASGVSVERPKVRSQRRAAETKLAEPAREVRDPAVSGIVLQPEPDRVPLTTVADATAVMLRPVSLGGDRLADAPPTWSSAAPLIGSAPLPVPVAAAPTDRPKHRDTITIRRVIQEYATAFGRLDPRAAKRVWPSLDEQALARAFRGLRAQSLTFQDCGVTLMGNLAAEANCHGRATYLPKVGRRRPFSTTGEWTFSLERSGSVWVIQSAAVQ